MIIDRLRQKLVPVGFPAPSVDEADRFLISEGYDQPSYRERLIAWGQVNGDVPLPDVAPASSLAVQVEEGSHVLTWVASPTQGVSYAIQTNVDEAGWSDAVTTKELTYTFEEVDPESEYSYRIVAFIPLNGENREETSPSNVVTIEPEVTEGD